MLLIAANQITWHWWWNFLGVIFKVLLPLQMRSVTFHTEQIQYTTWQGQTPHDPRFCRKQCSTSQWIHLPGSTGVLQEVGYPWPWSLTGRLMYPSETPASKRESKYFLVLLRYLKDRVTLSSFGQYSDAHVCIWSYWSLFLLSLPAVRRFLSKAIAALGMGDKSHSPHSEEFRTKMAVTFGRF